MKLVADFHTHTVASTHAYSTINENAEEAHRKGLIALAVTDHAMKMLGAPDIFYFRNLRALSDYICGVRVLKGIEANIMDYEGNLDADADLLSRLDICIASMHLYTLREEPSVDKCTQAYLNICKNPHVDIIGHSGQVHYKYDYETVIKECANNNKLIEINNASFINRPESIVNCIEIAKLCKKYNCMITVDSDSHFHPKIGECSLALKMLEEIEFPEELIVNANEKNLQEFLKYKNIRF